MTILEHDDSLRDSLRAMPFRPALPLLRSRALLRVSGFAGITIAVFALSYFAAALVSGAGQ